jgi:fumarate hydratase class II
MRALEEGSMDAIKCGRTHLQDAVPITFAEEVSGWRGMLEASKRQIEDALAHLSTLAIGGTAVGTGLNAPKAFDQAVCTHLSQDLGVHFTPSDNKYHALTSKDAIAFAHGALKALACNLMKIANDVRWLASGPKCGLGEISIPANEPGSSIMPGKVNPTQCEALTMVAAQVIANDTAIAIGASQGNFELNVYMPLIIYNYLQSARLLRDAICSFDTNCAQGITVNRAKMKDNLDKSLMLATALNPYIGYDNAAKVAKKAYAEGLTLKEAAVALGLMTAEEYDQAVRPDKMV